MHCAGHRQIPATFTSTAHSAGRGPVAYGHSPLVAPLSFHTDKRGRPLSRIRWPLKVLCICHLAVASLAISSFAFSDISHTILCGLVILLFLCSNSGLVTLLLWETTLCVTRMWSQLQTHSDDDDEYWIMIHEGWLDQKFPPSTARVSRHGARRSIKWKLRFCLGIPAPEFFNLYIDVHWYTQYSAPA